MNRDYVMKTGMLFDSIPVFILKTGRKDSQP